MSKDTNNWRSPFVLGTITVLFLGLVLYQPLVFLLQPPKKSDPSSPPSSSQVAYQEYGSLTLPDYQTFGDRGQYVVSAKEVGLGKDYIVSSSRRFKDRYLTTSGHIEEGEYYKVAYQRIDRSSSKQVFNISQWLKDHKPGYGLSKTLPVMHYQGADYLPFVVDQLVNIVEGEAAYRKVWVLNLATEEVSQATEEMGIKRNHNKTVNYKDPFGDSLSSPVYGTSLSNRMNEDNYAEGAGNFLGEPGVQTLKDEESVPKTAINLYVAYPELKTFLEDHNHQLFINVRDEMVTPEEWFNDLLYWFAPVGEDRLTVHTNHGGERRQADEVAIRSYADYLYAESLAGYGESSSSSSVSE